MYPFIYFFESTISSFNLLVGVGAILGILYYNYISSKVLSKELADNLLLIIVLSAVFGFLSAILFNKLLTFRIDRTLFEYEGMSFLGGLVGGVIAFLIMYVIIMKSFRHLMLAIDAAIPSLLIAHAFGRIGCFLGGCCYGQPCEAFGVHYPLGSFSFERFGSVAIFPIQLIESALLFTMFIFFVRIIKKNLLAPYLFSYGILRFIIEFFRGDDRGTMINDFLSPSQYISILIAVLGFVFFLIQYKKRNS